MPTMSDLWTAIAELATALGPERLTSAASKIEEFPDANSIKSSRDIFGPNLEMIRWTQFLNAWQESPEVSPRAVGAALRTSSRMSEMLAGGQALDLVWTGPSSTFVPMRSTEQVMLELIRRARQHIFLATYVNYGATSVIAALNAATQRGVSVRMLLEGSMRTTAELAAKVSAAEVYIWGADAKPPVSGKTPPTVHAKCVVADRAEALITSANLTDHALGLNMELGVHIMRGREPEKLHDHLNALVATDEIQRFMAGTQAELSARDKPKDAASGEHKDVLDLVVDALRGPLRRLLDAGCAAPIVGYEVPDTDGLELELAWPGSKQAVAVDLTMPELQALRDDGWTLLATDGQDANWAKQVEQGVREMLGVEETQEELK